MKILGQGTGESIEVAVPDSNVGARIYICEGDGMISAISVDQNHLQALEMAVRAARLELEARSIG